MEHNSEFLLRNAVIYPQDTAETYSCMACRDGKILYAGCDEAYARSLLGAGAEIMDAGGRAVIPAFVDSHTHPTCISLTAWRTILKGSTLEELLENAKAFCEAHPPEEVPFFFGESFRLEMFDEHGPRKELLDRYVSDRPARMQDFTDHSCWYNSKALELMGIRKGEPDPAEKPPMGEIIRDENGEPTGWVREVPGDDLDRLIYKAVGWEPELVPTENGTKDFLSFMTRGGACVLMDAIAPEESLQLFRSLDREGRLDFIYDGCVLLPEYEALEETVAEALRLKAEYESEHVRIHTVKFFLDGTNELGDMASLEALRTDPAGEDYGHINMTTEELTDVMLRLNRENLDLHLHIVGDRAFRTACDALEKAKETEGDNFRIFVTAAHCELVHPDDMPRPAELGMFINWSCHWAGGYFGEKSRDYLGRERFDTMYDFTTMLRTGARVAFSSDVFSYKEADRARPFFGIQVSATRVDPQFPLPEERFPGSVRTPEHARLPVEALIKGYTLTGAEQLRLDHRLGSITPGKDASFLILSENPYETAPEDLGRIYPLLTAVEGRIVYEEK